MAVDGINSKAALAEEGKVVYCKILFQFSLSTRSFLEHKPYFTRFIQE